jgi:hypothetical protein
MSLAKRKQREFDVSKIVRFYSEVLDEKQHKTLNHLDYKELNSSLNATHLHLLF